VERQVNLMEMCEKLAVKKQCRCCKMRCASRYENTEREIQRWKLTTRNGCQVNNPTLMQRDCRSNSLSL